MNILKDSAGWVTNEHILKTFTVYKVIEINDMGQATYELPQYTNGTIKIKGGYWNYVVTDMNNKELWSGWWNSNDEFDSTISDLMKETQ
jgi:hypothetical protein